MGGPGARPGGIDFFDVDHTLTRRSSGARFVVHAVRRRVLPWHLLAVMAWYSIVYRWGLFRPAEYGGGFPHLRGIPRATLERLARESFERRLRGDLFPGARQVVQRLRASGRRVMLATSSLDFIVQPLAEFLGVDGVLATELEFEAGKCTGRIRGRPMFRGGKMERVLALLAAEGVPPEECSFYSDSIYDLPFLERVGNPVAVNPDPRLRRVARARGWRVTAMAGSPPAPPPAAGRR